MKDETKSKSDNLSKGLCILQQAEERFDGTSVYKEFSGVTLIGSI